MELEVKDVSCGYALKTVVSGISLAMTSGDLLCLLGPNGVGKTTFFKALLGLLKVQSGKILLNGEDISTWPHRKIATKVGYVPQTHSPPFPFKVLDVVVMGRAAHVGMFSSPSLRDRTIAEEALAALGIAHLAERVYTELSGGERQLVMIARALAQQPEILIMDEPTSNLDFGNQIKVLGHIKRLTEGRRLGVIMTTHLPNHAFLCASKVAVMGHDRSFTIGTPETVITGTYLKQVYGVEVKVIEAGRKNGKGTRVCVPVLPA